MDHTSIRESSSTPGCPGWAGWWGSEGSEGWHRLLYRERSQQGLARVVAPGWHGSCLLCLQPRLTQLGRSKIWSLVVRQEESMRKQRCRESEKNLFTSLVEWMKHFMNHQEFSLKSYFKFFFLSF